MQVAIDNAKRQFDIDLSAEIDRIKKDMDIDKNGYPHFWKIIKKNFKGQINTELHCPMNFLYNLNLKKYRSSDETIPLSHFFVSHQLDDDRRICKRVEEIISKYSLRLSAYNRQDENDNEDYLLLRSDFDDMIEDIRSINISKNYTGLMSYLINRAFMVTPNINSNRTHIKTTLDKNKSLLLKVLFDVNKDNFLRCFSENRA